MFGQNCLKNIWNVAFVVDVVVVVLIVHVVVVVVVHVVLVIVNPTNLP